MYWPKDPGISRYSNFNGDPGINANPEDFGIDPEMLKLLLSGIPPEQIVMQLMSDQKGNNPFGLGASTSGSVNPSGPPMGTPNFGSGLEGMFDSDKQGGFTQPQSDSGAGGFGSQIGGSIKNVIEGILSGLNPLNPAATTSKEKRGNTLDELYQAMVDIIQPIDIPDYESSLEEAAQAINQGFGSQIGAIRSSNRKARGDTRAARGQVKEMYEALARSYEKSAKREGKQGKKLANQIQKVSGGSAASIKANASDILNQQAALAEGLGVESAIPEVSSAQLDNVGKQIGQLTREGDRGAKRQLEFGGNQRRFLNRQGMGSRLEGTNREADLIADLQNFLQGNREKIGELQGARGLALSELPNSIMETVTDAELEAQKLLWDQFKTAAQLNLDIENSRFKNKLDKQKFKASLQEEASPAIPDFMQDYVNALGQSSNPAGLAEILNPIVFGNRAFLEDSITAKDGIRTIDLTPAQAGEIAVAEALKANPDLSDSDISIIRMAAMLFAEGNG